MRLVALVYQRYPHARRRDPHGLAPVTAARREVRPLNRLHRELGRSLRLAVEEIDDRRDSVQLELLVGVELELHVFPEALLPTRLVFASATGHLCTRWHTHRFPVYRLDQARPGHQGYAFGASPGAAKRSKNTVHVRGWTPVLQPLVAHVFFPLSSKTGSRFVLS